MDPLFILGLGVGPVKAIEKLAEKAIIDPALEQIERSFGEYNYLNLCDGGRNG